MNGININNLFLDGSNKIKRNDPLTVHSLFNKNTTQNNNDNSFITTKLINERKKRKYQALLEYRRIMKSCISDIDRVNDIGYVNMIFTIPMAIINNVDYNSHECAEYVFHKLKDLSFRVTKKAPNIFSFTASSIYSFLVRRI